MFEYHESPSFAYVQNGSGSRSRSLWAVHQPFPISPSMDAGWNMIGQPAQGPLGATAHCPWRDGCPKSTPVSTTATLTPSPWKPSRQASHALCSRAIAQDVGDADGRV